MKRWFMMCLWLAFVSPLSAQVIVTDLVSVADAFVRSVDPAHNYGGAGALAVSGLIATNVIGQQEGVLDSFMRFDVSGAVSNFNSSFGAGRWVIVRATLNLTEVGAPNNAIFNRGVGPFEVHWMGNDSWLEGTGNPNAPITNGVDWNDEASILNSNTHESLGTFVNGGTDGVVRATLGMPSSFVSDISTGGSVSFYMTAASNSPVGFTFYSHNFPTTTAWPFLEIAAIQMPRIASLMIAGTDVKIVFATSANLTNTVEYCSNLASNGWGTLTNIVGTGGSVIVGDAGAATLPRRFYRVHVTVTNED